MRIERKKFYDAAGHFLRKMFPYFFRFNLPDVAPSDVVIPRNLTVDTRIAPNCQHLYLSQFSIRRFFTVFMAFSAHHISRIIRHCAAYQMVRINARRIITVMADYFVCNIFAGYCLIHQAMGKQKLIVKKNTSISSAGTSTYPQPTRFSFLNKRHQSRQGITLFFGGLITGIRTVLQTRFFSLKQAIASTACLSFVHCTREEFALIRAVDAFRCSKWMKNTLTLFTNMRLGYARICHLDTV